MIIINSKIYFILIGFLLIFVNRSFATSIEPVHIFADSLSVKSTTLSLAWKFHEGDNLEWANVEYNDSDWDTLSTLIPTKKPGYDSWNGIGWFRRIIKIDSSLINQSVAFAMRHFGASQIYLNGELIHKYGHVADNLDEEKIHQPRSIPLSLQFSTDTVYVLAIRYSNFNSVEDKDWYKKWFDYAGFQIRLSELDKAIRNSVHNEGLTLSINIGISALSFSLSVLYIILFIFYSRKKENLYYSLFTFFIALTFLSQMLGRFNHSSLTFFIIINILNFISAILIFLSYLAFLYSIFNDKFPKQFWLFITFALSIILIATITNVDEDLINNFVIGIILLATIEGLRIIIFAIKQKKENAKVIGTGVIIFVFFVLTMFVIGMLGMGNINSIWGIILFFIGLISVPLSMSVYLARDIASTNLKLEEQIVTVKELSEIQIQQERNNAELKLQAELNEAENKRKTKELEEARELQLSMLPKELPEIPNLDIAVYMKTASEVGGDYYDFHTDIDGTLTVVLGDATGHGMKAGTMVTATKSLFGSYAANKDIIYTFHEMTRCLKQLNFHMLSMCLAMVKINDKNITLSSAGIPPILICRKDENKVEPFVIKGMPLGTIEKFPYKVVESELNGGDTVLIMSDGFPELMNSKKEMYGYNNVIKYFERIANDNPEEIIAELKKEMNTWTDGADPDDDVTFVVLKMK